MGLLQREDGLVVSDEDGVPRFCRGFGGALIKNRAFDLSAKDQGEGIGRTRSSFAAEIFTRSLGRRQGHAFCCISHEM